MQDQNQPFQDFQDEPTQDIKPEPKEKIKETEPKEEIIPLRKRHIFSLMVAGLIIFIFGSLLGYFYGKNVGRKQLLEESFANMPEITEDNDMPVKLNPEPEKVEKPDSNTVPEPEPEPKPKPKPEVKPKQPPSTPSPQPVEDKHLQIASFKSKEKAEDSKKKFEKDGYYKLYIKKIDLKKKGTWYRLMLGPVSVDKAKTLQKEFKSKYKIESIIK